MSTLLHKLALSRLPGMNRQRASAILGSLDGNEEMFFTASSADIAELTDYGRSRLFAPGVREAALEKARREMDFLERNGVKARFFTDADFPSRLEGIDDAPVMIFTLGECDLDAARVVGIVGTRHATAYGTDFTAKLVSSLARDLAEPTVIVSGLAYGIDVAAHRAAMTAGLPTAGVLAHGLSTIYPAAHRNVAAAMIQGGGALVTEYTSADPVHRGNFLSRNRIVAGMCDCLVVVESDTKGGALVTARLAFDYGRDVFALPGRVSDRYSRGCNNLISSHMAQILTDAEALPDLMGWKRRPKEGEQQELFAELDPTETRIVEALTRQGEMSLSELKNEIDEQTHKLAGLLIDMELRGLVLSIPGNRYRLA